MNNTIRLAKLEKLKANIHDVWAVNDILNEMWETKDSWYIIPLLNLLDDDDIYEEHVMEEITGIVEAFPLDIYTQKLIESLPHYYIKSPRCCMYSHIRYFNTPNGTLSYLNILKEVDSLSVEIKSTIQKIIIDIEQECPEKNYDFADLLEYVCFK